MNRCQSYGKHDDNETTKQVQNADLTTSIRPFRTLQYYLLADDSLILDELVVDLVVCLCVEVYGRACYCGLLAEFSVSSFVIVCLRISFSEN